MWLRKELIEHSNDARCTPERRLVPDRGFVLQSFRNGHGERLMSRKQLGQTKVGLVADSGERDVKGMTENVGVGLPPSGNGQPVTRY